MRAGLALLLGLLVSGAAAQDLTAYRTLAYSLDRAAAQVGSDREAARAELGRAETALTALAPTLPGGEEGALASNLRTTVARAQSALSRTPAEVQANVLLTRGLLRRALYDQALGTLPPQPGAANDSAALRLLGRELGLQGEELASLSLQARLGQRGAVQWQVQRVAANKVLAALQATGTNQPRTTNYLSLTRASSWFALVREPGREATPPLGVPQFEQALQQVSSGDQTGLAESLTNLQAGATDLNQRLAAHPPAAAPATSGAPASPDTTIIPDPATATTDPGTSDGGDLTPGVTEQTPPAATEPAAPAPAAANTPVQTLDAVYAALARALTASGHGDPAQARTSLAQVTPLLGELPPAVQSAPAFEPFGRDLQTLQQRSGLRPDDIQALIATLGSAEQQAAGQAVAGSDGFSAGVARSLGGGVRALLGLALAALCLLPLYLLRLAFGGSNVYWRSIWAGLLTVLLPLLFEGLFGLLGWLGDLLDLPLLRGAVNLTLSQGAGGLLVRGLLSAAGLALLAYGFRGLCQQFGLLGRRVAAVPTSRPPSRYTQADMDWDEEL